MTFKYSISTIYNIKYRIDSSDKEVISVIESMKIKFNRSEQSYILTKKQYDNMILLIDNGFEGDPDLSWLTYDNWRSTFSSEDLGVSHLSLKEALKACKKPYRCPKTIDMFSE
jgi:hypothetical protein